MDRGIGTTHLAESLQAFAEQEAGDRSSGVAESEILSALKNPELLNSCNSCLLSSVIHLESKPKARLHNRVLFTESVNLWFIGSLNDAEAPNACWVKHRAKDDSNPLVAQALPIAHMLLHESRFRFCHVESERRSRWD